MSFGHAFLSTSAKFPAHYSTKEGEWRIEGGGDGGIGRLGDWEIGDSEIGDWRLEIGRLGDWEIGDWRLEVGDAGSFSDSHRVERRGEHPAIARFAGGANPPPR
ncbi:MAG: hypothetical protein D6796_11290 [Caldilineae bacterium]|nr:MAG: hypothetical protein D6796_11290 [Caldilineae bacterium]